MHQHPVEAFGRHQHHFFGVIFSSLFLGDFAANHAKERVKRRKSLTKLSINELGVDDTHPWLPRSPNPLTPPAEHHDKSPRSPSGQSPRSGGSGSAKLGSKEDPNRNLFFENVKPTDSTNEKLECMDRTSFRRLMDDLDNITIQEPINDNTVSITRKSRLLEKVNCPKTLISLFR